MPNYTLNQLIVTCNEGFEKELLAFIEKAKAPETLISMNNFFPCPQELTDTKSPCGFLGYYDAMDIINAMTRSRKENNWPHTDDVFNARLIQNIIDGAKGKANMKKYGYPTWYEFHCEEWGTKWDIREAEIKEQDACKIVYFFHTAWCHPKIFFEKVSIWYPNLLFSNQYVNEGEDYIGLFEVKGGQIVTDDYREINS